MVNVFVVPSLLPAALQNHNFGAPVHPCDIAKMVKTYRDKIRENTPVRDPPLKLEHKIESNNEYLALRISQQSIDLVRSQKGCEDLVALFSVEPGIDRNTIILMALDSNGDLLRDASGNFGQAEETWPVKLAVNASDEEFSAFFKHGAPCP